MYIIDRYIAISILKSTAIVMLFLVALFTFITFVDQLGDVGKGNYGSIQAAVYVLLIIPRIVYQMFPIAALLGAIIGLGMLANNNELTVIRAAGISINRIILSVMKVGALLIVIVIIIGEWVAPLSERYAQIHRSVAMSNALSIGKISGVWARDGLRFINIEKVLPDGKLGDVNIYELDKTRKLNKITQAKEAYFIDDNWSLKDVTEVEFRSDSINVQHYENIRWVTTVSPDLLSIVIVKPETLSLVGLYRYISYLKENELDASRYELAFWNKIVLPIVTGVMIFLAVPFVFGSLRSVSIGQRIMYGTFVGVFFYITNQVLGYVALVYHFNTLIGAVAPALGFFLFALYKVRKIY